MQEILNNGKLRDIYNLKGIYFFYKNQPNEMFLSFRDAYLKYETDSIMTNYSSKLELLIDNIIYAFFKMHIWDNSLYPIYFIEKNKQVKKFLHMSSKDKEYYIYSYEARGVITTCDKLFNLPLL